MKEITSSALLLMLGTLAFSGCGDGSKSSVAPPDSSPGSGDAGGKDGSAPDAAADAQKADGVAPSDRPPADASFDLPNGAGCGAGSLCLALRNQYAEVLQQQKSCTAGAQNACAMKANSGLGCGGGCPVWVNDNRELDSLAAAFQRGGCETCLYGSPTGDRCHPTICADLTAPACKVTLVGKPPTCVDMAMKQDCPPGVMPGAPCNHELPGCQGGDGPGGICACDGSDHWTCF